MDRVFEGFQGTLAHAIEDLLPEPRAIVALFPGDLDPLAALTPHAFGLALLLHLLLHRLPRTAQPLDGLLLAAHGWTRTAAPKLLARFPHPFVGLLQSLLRGFGDRLTAFGHALLQLLQALLGSTLALLQLLLFLPLTRRRLRL